MSQELYCQKCHKHMATLRDARVRNGMVVLCSQCAAPKNTVPDTPDFVQNIYDILNRKK